MKRNNIILTIYNIHVCFNKAFYMYLMSYCHNFIICSSSVGWWAAYLSKRCETKIVIKSEPQSKTDTKKEMGYKLIDNWLSINCYEI